MELGPIQKAWVKSLRDHPERQMGGALGVGDCKNYKACCLGQALINLCEIKNVSPKFDSGRLFSFSHSGARRHGVLSTKDYNSLGLVDNVGVICVDHRGYVNGIDSLSSCNDQGMAWPEIADFIEKYPEAVFTKSV